MSAADIITMMEEYEQLAKEVGEENQVSAYYIRLYYLMQALTQIGSNKSTIYMQVKKHCSERIAKLETDKKSLGDIKSDSKK